MVRLLRTRVSFAHYEWSRCSLRARDTQFAPSFVTWWMGFLGILSQLYLYRRGNEAVP